jgi:hypothetical protein
LQPAVAPLEQAAEAVAIADAPQPIVIANYGAAERHNSLAPMAIAIAALFVARLDTFPGEDRIRVNLDRDRNAAAFGRRRELTTKSGPVIRSRPLSHSPTAREHPASGIARG